MTSVISRMRPDESPARSRQSNGQQPDIALLPIGADLLPRQAVAGRGGRGRRYLALAIVAVAVLAVAGVYALALHGRTIADDRLAAAQDQHAALLTQQRGFADLVATQTQATELRNALASVMATDAPWSTLLAQVGKVRGGVTFTGVNASLVDTTAQTTTTPVTAGGIGTVSINGTAADKPTIASFVDALSGLDGLSDPFLSSVTAQQSSGASTGGYTFTVTVNITDDLQSAAKSRWATTTGGGK